MIIHRDGWQYSGRVPAFFPGQAGCFCCTAAVAGTYCIFYGDSSRSGTLVRDTESWVSDTWTSRTDAPSPARDGHSTATCNLKAYSFGGVQSSSPYYMPDTEEFVLSSDTWTSKTDNTVSKTYDNAATVSEKAYIIAGFVSGSYSQRTDEYDAGGDTFSNKTACPSPARRGNVCYSYSGVVYSMMTDFSRDNDAYTVASDTWASKTDGPTPTRFTRSGFGLGEYGYVIAGSGSGVALRDNDRYSSSGDSWTAKADILSPGRTGCASFGNSSSMAGYITGGDDFSATMKAHQEYVDDTWTSRADIPTPARRGAGAAESA